MMRTQRIIHSILCFGTGLFILGRSRVVDAADDRVRVRFTAGGVAPGPDEPRRFSRPKAMKDLVCLHVILMALRVCNYDVDLDALGARRSVLAYSLFREKDDFKPGAVN